jgi:hypothetical protein
MTNLLLERLLRYACFTFLAVMLVLVVTACGPGGGGTGTGPIQTFSTLATPPLPTTPSGGPITGPGSVTGGASACGRIDLHMEEGRVELVTGCGSFVFVGGWTVDSRGQVELPGTVQPSAGGNAARATLLLQFSGAPETSPSVTVSLMDEAGQILVAPEVLGRVENLPARTPG